MGSRLMLALLAMVKGSPSAPSPSSANVYSPERPSFSRGTPETHKGTNIVGPFLLHKV